MIIEQMTYKFNENVEGKEVKIAVNKKDAGITLQHLIKKMDTDEDEVSGYSLLQFYQRKNGNLYDINGNEITFWLGGKQIHLINVTEPWALSGELRVDLKYIKDVAEVLGTDASDQFGKYLAKGDAQALLNEKDERIKKLKEKETEKAEAKKKEGEEAAASQTPQIPEGENILSLKDAKLLIRKLQRMGLKQYKDGILNFFYGEDAPENQPPVMLADREHYFEILDGSLQAEDPVEYEFTDVDGLDKILVLENGKAEISEL